MSTYKSSKALNGKKSPSTGHCVSFYGKSPWHKTRPYMFFEVADCSMKVRLHNSGLDTHKDFLVKMKKMRSELNKYIEFLESV